MFKTLGRLVALTLMSITFTPAVLAADFYVRKSGSDSNNGRNKNQAFASLDKAVQSAGSTDKIYVGAGTYRESVRRIFPSGSDVYLQILADLDGQATGDRGTVRIEPPAYSQALDLQNLGGLYVSDIEFGASNDTQRFHGISARNTSNYVYANRCTFDSLFEGFESYNSQYSYAFDCTFNNVSTAMHVDNALYGYAYACRFNDCYLSVTFRDVEYAYAYGSTFTEITTNRSQYAIRASKAGLYVYSCTIDDTGYGIYGSDMTACAVRDTTINRPRGYGIYVLGTNLEAYNVSILGEGNRRGHGLAYSDTEGGTANLSNVTTSGLHSGIVYFDSTYVFSEVHSSGNACGLYINGSTEEFVFDQQDEISLTDNSYAIYYLRSGSTKGELTMVDADIRDNDVAVYSYNCNASLRNCRFSENGGGASITRADRIEVSNCVFADNLVRNNSHFGLKIESETIEISDSEFNASYVGLQISNLSSQSPKLLRLKMADNSYIGLRVLYGRLELDANSKVAIRGSQHGIYCSSVDCVFSSILAPEACSRSLWHSRGSLTIDDLALRDGDYGIYCQSLDRLHLTNVSLSGMSYTGLYSINSGESVLESVAANNTGLYGLSINNPAELHLNKIDVSHNARYGLYCTFTGATDKTFSISNSVFQDNYYGVRCSGTPFNPRTANNVRFTDNRQGLEIDYADLELTSDMQIEFTENGIAALTLNGGLTANGIIMKDNLRGLQCTGGPLRIVDSSISATDHAVLCYSGGSTIHNTNITDANYGVYFAPRDPAIKDLTITNSQISNVRQMGIYASCSSSVMGDLIVRDCNISQGSYGIYSSYVNTDVKRTKIRDTRSTGVFQRLANCHLQDVDISGPLSWGILSYSTNLTLDRVQVSGRYGIHLQVEAATILNSVVRDGIYGVYVNSPDADIQILQSTIGNIKNYGVYHIAGNLTVQNSIIDSKFDGLVSSNSEWKLEHDYNLIHADRKSYVNTSPGPNEIQKQPIFVNSAGGDLRLAAGSPAINAGQDLSSVTVADMDGNARPSFGQFEIGAYEFMENAGSLRVLDWDELAELTE